MAKERVRGYAQQLADYIKKNLSKGYTLDSLRWALIEQGHSRIETEKAIDLANSQLAMQAPKMVEKPVIKVEKEPIPHQINSEKESEPLWKKIKKIFSQ